MLNVKFFDEVVSIPNGSRAGYGEYLDIMKQFAESDNQTMLITGKNPTNSRNIVSAIRRIKNLYYHGWCVYQRGNEVYVVKA